MTFGKVRGFRLARGALPRRASSGGVRAADRFRRGGWVIPMPAPHPCSLAQRGAAVMRFVRHYRAGIRHAWGLAHYGQPGDLGLVVLLMAGYTLLYPVFLLVMPTFRRSIPRGSRNPGGGRSWTHDRSRATSVSR